MDIYIFVHHRSIIPSIDRRALLSSFFGRNFPVVPPLSSRRNEIDRGATTRRDFSPFVDLGKGEEMGSGEKKRGEKKRAGREKFLERDGERGEMTRLCVFGRPMRAFKRLPTIFLRR